MLHLLLYTSLIQTFTSLLKLFNLKYVSGNKCCQWLTKLQVFKCKCSRKAKLYREGRVFDVPGGLDFSNAVFDEKMGKLCMEKQEEIESIEKKPVLECNHK